MTIEIHFNSRAFLKEAGEWIEKDLDIPASLIEKHMFYVNPDDMNKEEIKKGTP